MLIRNADHMYATVAVVMIATGLPLAIRLIPRNPVYGYRTRETLATDDAWYPANARAGLVLVILGLWLGGLTRLHPELTWSAKAIFADTYLLAPLLITALILRGRRMRRADLPPPRSAPSTRVL